MHMPFKYTRGITTLNYKLLFYLQPPLHGYGYCSSSAPTAFGFLL